MEGNPNRRVGPDVGLATDCPVPTVRSTEGAKSVPKDPIFPRDLRLFCSDDRRSEDPFRIAEC